MRKNVLVFLCLMAMLRSITTFAGDNLIYVSWGDHIMIGNGTSMMDTPEKIQSCLKFWKDGFDGNTILWRISSEEAIRFHELRTLTPFAIESMKKIDSIKSVFDPIKLVREQTRKNGQKLLLYATFLDHGAPSSELYGDSSPFSFQDKETIAHPEYQEKDLAGKYHYGVLDLSVPEARKFEISRLVNFVHEYDADGLYVCSRTHSPPALHADQFGFGENIVKEYQKRYGIDITKDARFDYRTHQYAPSSDALENWRKLRGEYLVLFYHELRQALADKLIYLGIPRGHYLGAPYGNLYLDYEKIIQEKLADGLVLGVFSGRSLHPYRKESHKSIGYKTSEDEMINIPSREETIASYRPLANKYGVKLYVTGSVGISSRNWLKSEAGINGLMVVAPPVRPWVSIQDNPAFCSGNPLTIEGMFFILKDQGGCPAPRLLSKYNHLDSQLRGWELILSQKGNLEFRTNLITHAGKQTELLIASDSVVPREQWVHLAAVFDPVKSENRIYINGKIVGTKKIPINSKLNNNKGQDIVIGSYTSGVMEFRGLIDEVRLTGEALDFNSPLTKPYSENEKATLILMHFDDSQRLKIDAAAPGFNAELVGSIVLHESVSGFGSALDLTGDSFKALPMRNDLPSTSALAPSMKNLPRR